SGDRAAIASLVYDALRQKASAAFVMDDSAPRAIVLGMLKRARSLDVASIEKLFDGGRFSPLPLSEMERKRFETASLDGAPPHIAGDYPEWLEPQFIETFSEERAE